MRRVTPLLLSIVLLFSLSACKAKKALDQAAISKDLKSKGTLELMKEAAEDQYEPPSDNRLTDQQIQMYLKVREHEKQIVQVARKEAESHAKKAEKSGEKSIAGMMAGLKTLGSVADMLTADVRAAQELGFNTAEYQWVKERILEASGAAFTEKTAQGLSAMMDTQVEALKKQLAETKDETTRQYLQQALEGAEKSRAEMAANAEPEEPSVTYNKQLLSKYENALNAFAHEFSKFEEKEGQAQEAVQKFEEDLKKAEEEAKQNQ